LRECLTPEQELIAGHADGGLKPSARGKGYGTKMLALTLEKAKELGLHECLLTCRKNNLPSKRVIERNGGEFLGETTRADGEILLRYRVVLIR
jgi:predicted acetyltransferase